MTRATLALLLPILLACSGLVDAALEGASTDPEFRASFEKSFRSSFTDTCSDGMAKQGIDLARSTQICTCAADKVAAGRSPAELVAMMSDAQSPEATAVVEEAMAACTAIPG